MNGAVGNLLTAAGQSARQMAHCVLPQAVRDVGWRALNISAAVRYLGVAGCRRLLAASNDPRPNQLSAFAVRTLPHPFWIRHGTSDADVLIHTVFRQTYGRRLPPAPPRWVLDLGANVGGTAAWFLTRFPDARVVAVEPDPANYEMLVRNLSPYGDRAILVNAGVWPSDGELVRHTGDNFAGSFVRPAAPGERSNTRAVSIPTLMQTYGIPEIDFLKCDIEAAEEPLFGENPDPWLSRTRHLCIELHAAAASATVHAATARHGFRGEVYRDIHVFRKG